MKRKKHGLNPLPISMTQLRLDLVLFLINTITYYLRYLSPPCYARFGRALICHEKARTRSSLLNKSERSWNDAPINIRYHILLLARAKMMLLAEQGLSNDEIANSLSTRREIVSRWRKRFFEKRLGGLEDFPRPGRPRVFPPRAGRAR